MKNIKNNLKILVLALLLITGVSYLKAWNGPTQIAPNGNISAPINVGSAVQTKLGSLVLNAESPAQNAIGLTVFGTSTLYGLNLANGSQGLNKVLASDAAGNAKWVATSTLGMGGNGTVTTGGSTVTSGGTADNYYFQIGNLLIEGGIAYPGNLKAITVTYVKPFKQIVSLQFTSLQANGGGSQVHPEDNVKAQAVTNTSFIAHTVNNNGYTWLAVGIAP